MDEEMVPAEYGDAEPGWAPRGEHDAEMALRGLDRMAARFAAIGQQATAYRADIDAWEQTEVHRLRSRATNLVLGLQAWARDRRLMSNHKDKTFRFPSGEIATRVVGSKVEIVDEAALIAWLKTDGTPAELRAALKVVESVLKSVLVKCEGVATHPADEQQTIRRYLFGGEVIPGLRFVQGHGVVAEVKLASQRALPAPSAGE
jgi:phage host-nuclease inhibitor protein Gam